MPGFRNTRMPQFSIILTCFSVLHLHGQFSAHSPLKLVRSPDSRPHPAEPSLRLGSDPCQANWWISTNLYGSRMEKRRGDRHQEKPVSLRIPRDLWIAVKHKAADHGETALMVVIRKLREYVDYD